MGSFDGVALDDLVLTGPRLTLRPWAAPDADAVLAAMADGSIARFVPVPQPYTRADAERFVTELGDGGRRDGTGLGSALVDTVTGRVVGSAAVTRLDGNGEVGYWIVPAARGHGYAAEATRLLADWAVRHGVRRIELVCDVRNLASAKTALAAGFGYEGTTRAMTLRPVDERSERRVRDMAWFARPGSDPGEPIAPAFGPLPYDRLTDGTVLLRTLAPGDAQAFYEQDADPLTVANGFTGQAPSRHAVTRMVTRAGLDWLVGQAATMTIVDAASGRFAGSLRLRLAGPPGVGGIGYAMHPAFRGRGYSARALRLLVPWAFGHGFARLELGAKLDNVASQRAALAAGFQPDGARAARLRAPDGSYHDEIRFALINPSVPRPLDRMTQPSLP